MLFSLSLPKWNNMMEKKNYFAIFQLTAYTMLLRMAREIRFLVTGECVCVCVYKVGCLHTRLLRNVYIVVYTSAHHSFSFPFSFAHKNVFMLETVMFFFAIALETSYCCSNGFLASSWQFLSLVPCHFISPFRFNFIFRMFVM